MLCSKCGTNNNPEAKFCIGCGSPIEQNRKEVEQPIFNQNLNTLGENQNEIGVTNFNLNGSLNQTIQQTPSPVLNNDTGGQGQTGSISFVGVITLLLSILLKPFTALKKEENKLEQFKNSFGISLFISIFAVIMSLLQEIIAVTRVRQMDYKTYKYVTKWVFSNIKEIEFVKVIGQNFLIYLGIIFGLACVFYIASMLIKKQVNFSKMVGFSAISMVPFVLSSLLLAPLAGMISATISVGFSLIGGIYTVLLLYETINNEIKLEGNQKYYFNIICFSILGIAAYYLYMKFFMSIGSDLSDLLDFFK